MATYRKYNRKFHAGLMKKPLLTEYLIKKRNKIVSKFIKGNVLDIGCGYAYILDLLNKNTEYVGIDIDDHLAGLILDKAKSKNIAASFYHVDIESEALPNLNKKFDTITMIAVIEHLKYPRNILDQVGSYLKEDGLLIISTPSVSAEIVHTLGAKVGLFCKEAVEKHIKFYNYNSMYNLLKSVNFEIIGFHKFELGMNQLFIAKFMN